MLDPMAHPGTARSAAFFDLDKTIIARSSTLAFSRPFYAGGLINRRTVLRSAYAQFVYLLGGADHDQMERMREYLSAMCTGWDVATVKAIVADTLHHIVTPMIHEEAVELIEQHHAAGRDVVIVSSSGAEVVEPIGAMLGADKVIATRMVVADGKYTGEIAEYAYGPHKATAMHTLAAAEGYDLRNSYAYSDSVTDEPMLAAVGHPHAVNPDKALRRLAVSRDWPVLDFSEPVGLAEQSRFRQVRRPAMTTVAVAGLAAWGLLYAARRRSRPAADEA
ncbi:HAD superfamily hydrolase (TIGR01490 family) [Kribbella antiqua]|uniref:HAD superfamily hydrolase (TIGR01490 family) n=1 Tax=Kribbella antiqua TaxID=2512217 RepID=A0A4R2IST0_9ACTN|nr:HAD-IB family hydrolase [Kribbella antiqua]TCO47612.1 HAD superfamily hydrolase (TIGR01490 family) [Kribbella antiqua]